MLGKCSVVTAIKQGSEDRQNSSDAELIDITRTYISEDQMLDVLVESLGRHSLTFTINSVETAQLVNFVNC